MNQIASTSPVLRREIVLHRAGMALSGLCLVHCLMLPLLLVAAPVMVLANLPTAWLGAEWFHAALLVPVVLVSGPVLWRGGARRIGVLVAALAALIAAVFVASDVLETALTVAGALGLLFAHRIALRQCRVHGAA